MGVGFTLWSLGNDPLIVDGHEDLVYGIGLPFWNLGYIFVS